MKIQEQIRIQEEVSAFKTEIGSLLDIFNEHVNTKKQDRKPPQIPIPKPNV